MATQQHSAGEPPSEKDHKLLNGCVPLSHQVAGHMYGKDKVGILQHPDGTVLKQLQPPPRGPRELDFYNMVSVSQDRLWGGGKPEDCPGQPPFHVPPVFQAEIALTHRCIQCLTFHMVITVFSSDCTDPKLRDLQIFLPKYFGTWAPPGSTNDLYLKLEDVTRKFDKPCIMDVKIGQKSYDPHASAEKIQQQISKYPLMEEIGFLVLGMRIYHMDSDSFETQNQHYGRRLTKDTIKPGLSKFFHNGCYLRKDAVSACLHKVQHILQWFEDQDTLHFYASSLLFVYDGSCPQSAVDGRVHEKKVCTTELLTEDEVTECNNNISIMSSMENGKNEELAGKKRCKIYAVHKKTCPKRLHSEAFLEGEDTTPQNPVPQEHLNGNLLTKLESVLCQVSADTRDSAQVDVRMIDFAHVFPSGGQDLGYIYGLKNLISVLQSILNE